MTKSKNLKAAGSLGLGACVAMLTGGMIGSAIFSLSGLTMYTAGPAALVSWIIAAVVMLIYGLIVSELSSLFPKSGGVFVFPAKALGKNPKVGKLWGWISCWGYINANIVAIAFAAIYVATYLGVSFPVFGESLSLFGKEIPMQIVMALAAIVFCLLLNMLRITVAGKANNVLVFGLVAALLIYVGVSLFGGSYDVKLLQPFFTQGSGGSGGFLAAVPTAMVGYGSIVAMAFMVSEVKDPNRTVPKSVMIAMLCVVCLYGLTILATLGLVSAQFLADNPGMRFIPLYAACFNALSAYPWMAKVVSIAAVLALLTTMLVVLALTSRALQSAAADRVLPKALSKNSRMRVPVRATLLIAIAAAIVSCFPAFTEEIVSFGALFAAFTISINIISLLVARKKYPNKRVRFRAPGGSVLPILALLIIVVCYIPDVISGGWVIWAYTLAWYAVGLLIYLCSPAFKKQSAPKAIKDGKEAQEG